MAAVKPACVCVLSLSQLSRADLDGNLCVSCNWCISQQSMPPMNLLMQCELGRQMLEKS